MRDKKEHAPKTLRSASAGVTHWSGPRTRSVFVRRTDATHMENSGDGAVTGASQWVDQRIALLDWKRTAHF